MPFQPAADERAERTNVEASRPRVVERISCDLRAHPLTLIPLGYLGVKKNDRVGRELVLRYTGERAVNPGLEAGVCRIVDDRHTHVAHCARGRAVWRPEAGSYAVRREASRCRLMRRAITSPPHCRRTGHQIGGELSNLLGQEQRPGRDQLCPAAGETELAVESRVIVARIG